MISQITPKSTLFKIHSVTSESLRLGILLATVGGFLDAYTFICRGNVFANAQTGNIVLVGVYLAQFNLNKAFMAFLPVLSFIIGAFVSEKIKDFSSKSSLLKESACMILLIEIISLLAVGFIPTTVSNNLVNIIIGFVSSVQICSFRKLVDSPYSTTMCTGNLRTACQAAYSTFIKKDNDQSLKFIRYSFIISSFIIGACICGLLTLWIGERSIWFCSITLSAALTLFIFDSFYKKEQN